MELAAFINARLDEDEAAAEGRDSSAPIHTVGCYYYNHSISPYEWSASCCDCEPEDQARAVREVEALRLIVALADRWHDDPNEYGQMTAILRALATIWRDHPSYDAAWEA